MSLVRQCALPGVSRSSIYYRPRAASAEDLSLMGAIVRQYLERPFYGWRRIKAWLERRRMPESRRRVQRLVRTMGLRAIYRRPSTSRRSPDHQVYPLLLGNVRITRPNQSLPPRRRGQAVQQPGVHPDPAGPGRADHMDWKGRYQDNIFVELPWRTVKYEEVYLKAYACVLEVQRGLENYFRFYNGLRPHQAIGYRTPAEVFHGDQGIVVAGNSNETRGSSNLLQAYLSSCLL